jgi:uncharacterized repeat protein (TIGR01451 family)
MNLSIRFLVSCSLVFSLYGQSTETPVGNGNPGSTTAQLADGTPLVTDSPDGRQVVADAPIPPSDGAAQTSPVSEVTYSVTAPRATTGFAAITATRSSPVSPAAQTITPSVLNDAAATPSVRMTRLRSRPPAHKPEPDLTISKSHLGNFSSGQAGATYTITVQNAGNAATSGTVTVSDAIPTGLTATAIAGTGWTCTQPAGPCTRIDALAAAATYPALTLTVNVAGNAPATVTNTATVSGGGETNTLNDTASDATTIAAAGAPDLTIISSHTANFTQGQTGATYGITVKNAGAAATTGTVTVSDTVPTGLTATAIAGAGWTCTQPAGPCNRSDALAAAASYPALTLTVNVAANAPATVTNTATVSGGGETNTSNDTASDATPIAAASVSDLTITNSHTGNFSPGQTGATYTITVTNSGTAATSGTVTVSDTVPTGLTATAIAGAGWTCTQPVGPCTRTNALAPAASYPALTLTMNVAGNAPATVINTATVSGGGETNTSNDTASDPTTIGATGSLVSDDFTSGALNSAWAFVNPKNDGSFSLNGNSLLLNVPAGGDHDAWTNGDNVVRVMQPAPDTDFEVEVKFSSTLDKQAPFQHQGIIVEQDATNFLRWSMYSDNQRTIVIVASILGTSGNVIATQETRGGGATWMRVKRTGNNWLCSYSYDSFHWTPFAFTQALHVTKIGPYAGNSPFNGGSAPAYTAIVDHFVNRASPLSSVDGSAYPPPALPPAINVWYGDAQTFGQPGIPQQWVNILGDVSDFDQVTTLTYSLNGGAEQPLWMGENEVRLVAPGDFNVEIDYASLNAGANTVRITATDTLGRQTLHNVSVNYVTGQKWPNNYSVNWSNASSLQSVSQVVDGKWAIQSAAARTTVTGYDRLIAIGDSKTWLNFVATAEVTMNSLDPFGFAVAIIAGWQGHTTLQYGQPLPDQPRTGHPFPAFGGYAQGLPGPPTLMIYENTPAVPENPIVESARTLQTGVKYIFKFQAQQNSSGGSHYSFKAWPATTAEPANWDLQCDGELSLGSIVLAAQRADVSFGAVTVTGL